MMTLSRCNDLKIANWFPQKTCTKITFNVTSSRAQPSFNDFRHVDLEKLGHPADLASHEYS